MWFSSEGRTQIQIQESFNKQGKYARESEQQLHNITKKTKQKTEETKGLNTQEKVINQNRCNINAGLIRNK